MNYICSMMFLKLLVFGYQLGSKSMVVPLIKIPLEMSFSLINYELPTYLIKRSNYKASVAILAVLLLLPFLLALHLLLIIIGLGVRKLTTASARSIILFTTSSNVPTSLQPSPTSYLRLPLLPQPPIPLHLSSPSPNLHLLPSPPYLLLLHLLLPPPSRNLPPSPCLQSRSSISWI